MMGWKTAQLRGRGKQMSKYSVRAECGHPDCREVAHYEADTRKDQTRLYEKYGNKKWRCTRHSNPEQVLSVANPKTTVEKTSEEKFYEGSSIGNFWGSMGFMSGPGFRAWAKDFPAGTTLRVTAEILLPSSEAKRNGSP